MRRLTARHALVLSLSVIAGCSLLPTQDQADRQQRAIARWERCVHEQAERLQPAALLPERLGAVCADYRRDVVDTYPPHLAPRINRLLIERAEDRLSSRLASEVRRLL